MQAFEKIIIINVFVHPKKLKCFISRSFIYLSFFILQAYSLSARVFFIHFEQKQFSIPLSFQTVFFFSLYAVCVYVFRSFFMAFFYAFLSLWFMKIDMISSQVYCSCRRTTIGMSFCICAWNTYKFTYDLGRSHSFTFILTQNSAHRKSSNDGSHIIRTCVQSN